MKQLRKKELFSYAVINSCLAGALSGPMMVIGYAMYHYYEYYDKLVLDISLESEVKNIIFHPCISICQQQAFWCF